MEWEGFSDGGRLIGWPIDMASFGDPPSGEVLKGTDSGVVSHKVGGAGGHFIGSSCHVSEGQRSAVDSHGMRRAQREQAGYISVFYRAWQEIRVIDPLDFRETKSGHVQRGF